MLRYLPHHIKTMPMQAVIMAAIIPTILDTLSVSVTVAIIVDNSVVLKAPPAGVVPSANFRRSLRRPLFSWRCNICILLS